MRRYSDQDLLEIVRQVSRHGEPANPVEISQRAYDAARSGAGLLRTPRAYRIAKRLKVPWPRLVRLAHGQGDPAKTVGIRRSPSFRDKLDRREIVHFLLLVSRHLGTNAFTVGEYDEARRTLLEADARRSIHGGNLTRVMPSGQMIVGAAGSWVKSLDWAGLKAPGKRGLPGYPAANALDDFIADFGYLPSSKALTYYVQARGVETVGYPRGSDYLAWRAEQMKSGPASRHGEVSPRTERGRLHLDPEKISPAPEGYASRRTKGVGLEQAKADLARALDLADGRNLTQREYQHLATANGLLSVATIQAIGERNGGLTWGELRDLTLGERAQAIKSVFVE